MACCRALGVDARFVSDTATYSWNEVFLEDEGGALGTGGGVQTRLRARCLRARCLRAITQ